MDARAEQAGNDETAAVSADAAEPRGGRGGGPHPHRLGRGRSRPRRALIDTPRRVASAYEDFYAGYGQDPADVLDRTFEDLGGYDDIVVVRDIPFYSHCEHHMVPFVGQVHVAYYPSDGSSACRSSPASSTSSPIACRRRSG